MPQHAPEVADKKLTMPSFVKNCGQDQVTTPDLTNGMEGFAPWLTRHHIEQCAAWPIG
jgi:hypothetical protein